MIFRPDFNLTVGTVAPDEWKMALVSLRVDLDAGALANACTLIAGTVRAPDVAPGDAVRVELGEADNLTTVFTGTVDSVAPGLTELRVHAVDGGAKLLALRLDQAYERVAAGDIVRDLAGRAGVATGQIEEGIRFPSYVVDSRRSAGQHVHTLASKCGFESYCDREDRLMFRSFARSLPDHTFIYGRDVLCAELFEGEPPIGRVQVTGESPAGSQGEDTWHWLAKDWSSYRGSVGSAGAALLVRDASLRTRDAAQTAADALLAELSAGAVAGTITVPGAPEVRLGDAIAIMESPDSRLNATFRVRRVCQALARERGFVTRIGFTVLPAGGLSP